ncbi:hypothetical protein [Streptomyces melanosporofaciens]|uniref:hypothetical protein n=1 Tax=Streptomyces melanosporofaciens TaxID=67327 RepID=UPI00142F7A03|nr:hypothetical protein [Streptomyces melanosporofaciens]
MISLRTRLPDVPRRGRKPGPLLLSEDERAVLERWTRRTNSARARANRPPISGN